MPQYGKKILVNNNLDGTREEVVADKDVIFNILHNYSGNIYVTECFSIYMTRFIENLIRDIMIDYETIKIKTLNLNIMKSFIMKLFDLSELDAGDGPASFLVLIYGAIVVPLAFLLEALFSPPLWVQAVLWGLIMLLATMKSLRPLKALMIGWQFRIHDPDKKYF